MFVDLDWPLNASSLLSASAELLVGICCKTLKLCSFHDHELQTCTHRTAMLRLLVGQWEYKSSAMSVNALSKGLQQSLKKSQNSVSALFSLKGSFCLREHKNAIVLLPVKNLLNRKSSMSIYGSIAINFPYGIQHYNAICCAQIVRYWCGCNYIE